MMAMTKTYSIHDIAREFDRLFAGHPEVVDATEISWGHGTKAGHIGHQDEDKPGVLGWYCQGGNVGHVVMSIVNEDIQLAGELLAAMETDGESLSSIERAFAAAGVRFERLG